MWNQNQHLFFSLLPSLQQVSALGPLEPTIFVLVLILPSNIPACIDILYCAVSSFLNTKNTDSKKSVMTSACNSQFNCVVWRGSSFESAACQCLWRILYLRRQWTIVSAQFLHDTHDLRFIISPFSLTAEECFFSFSYSLTVALPLIVLALPLYTWPSCVIHIVPQGMRTKVVTLRPQPTVSECCFNISASSFNSFCHSFLPSAFFLNV